MNATCSVSRIFYATQFLGTYNLDLSYARKLIPMSFACIKLSLNAPEPGSLICGMVYDLSSKVGVILATWSRVVEAPQSLLIIMHINT